MTPQAIAAIAQLTAQVIQMAMTYYNNQGKIPTFDEINANYVEIQAIIEAEKVK